MDLNQKINTILHNIKNKEFKTVINKCEKLVSSKVENTIIYNLYGLAYQNLGLYEKSNILPHVLTTWLSISDNPYGTD